MVGIIFATIFIVIFWVSINSINEKSKSVFIAKWKYPIYFTYLLIAISGISYSSYVFYIDNKHDAEVLSGRAVLDTKYRAYTKAKEGAVSALALFENAARPVSDGILKKNLGRVVVSLVRIPDCCISAFKVKYQNNSDYVVDLGKLGSDDEVSYTENLYFSKSQDSESLRGSGRINPGKSTVPEYSKIFSAGRITNVRPQLRSNIFVDRSGASIDFFEIAAKSRNDLSTLKKAATEAAAISVSARSAYRFACVNFAQIVRVKLSDIERFRQTDDWESVDQGSATDLDRCYTEFGKEGA
jgi:hypothetical protein